MITTFFTSLVTGFSLKIPKDSSLIPGNITLQQLKTLAKIMKTNTTPTQSSKNKSWEKLIDDGNFWSI